MPPGRRPAPPPRRRRIAEAGRRIRAAGPLQTMASVKLRISKPTAGRRGNRAEGRRLRRAGRRRWGGWSRRLAILLVLLHPPPLHTRRHTTNPLPNGVSHPKFRNKCSTNTDTTIPHPPPPTTANANTTTSKCKCSKCLLRNRFPRRSLCCPRQIPTTTLQLPSPPHPTLPPSLTPFLSTRQLVSHHGRRRAHERGE